MASNFNVYSFERDFSPSMSGAICESKPEDWPAKWWAVIGNQQPGEVQNITKFFGKYYKIHDDLSVSFISEFSYEIKETPKKIINPRKEEI